VADRPQRAFTQRLRRLFGAAPKPLPAHVTVGRHTYGLGARNVVRPSALGPIRVGAFCSIGPDVLLFGQADHPTHLPSTYPLRGMLLRPGQGVQDAITRGPLTVGNDVWIGARAMVLSGVTVGDGAVIGAGAVVARDVAPYAIMVGNPARRVRFRFPPEIVASLLEIKWWDWPDARIAALEEAFYGPVETFLERARQ
jgi:acetyltransferase-like isoleucine patch superfamily enzyme